LGATESAFDGWAYVSLIPEIEEDAHDARSRTTGGIARTSKMIRLPQRQIARGEKVVEWQGHLATDEFVKLGASS